MKKLSEAWWYIVDRVFPWPQPFSQKKIDEEREKREKNKAEWEKRVAALPDEETALVGHLGECAKLLEEEEGRRLSVDVRLTSIVGLCSIAGTVVFGGILAQATGTLRIQETWMQCVMAIGSFYLTAQLCSAILAAVRGLSRKNYPVVISSGILPDLNEDRHAHLRRRIRTCFEMLSIRQTKTNDKVTQMDVAHCAIKNFLWILLAIALLGAGYGATVSHEDTLIEKLKKYHEIQQLLRGPQGPPGPPGPRGIPCVNPTSLPRGKVPIGQR
jgi:cobalamin biosynthesis Mg chelatase CobN